MSRHCIGISDGIWIIKLLLQLWFVIALPSSIDCCCGYGWIRLG